MTDDTMPYRTDTKSHQERATALTLCDEGHFKRLVTSVIDYAIYMLDPGGRVVSWNLGAERIKGYTADEIIGQNFSKFYTEEDQIAGRPHQNLETAKQQGKFEAEGWRVRKDGIRFWASVVVDPILDDSGLLVGFAKITRDLTEKKEAERALDQAREALFQAQKMEAVGQLTSGLAHDFNNMLAGVSGSLEMIQTRLAQGRIADLERYIMAAQESSKRAASLTHRLLAFSRRQTLEPKIIDINELVSGMENMIRRSMEPSIALEVVLGGGLWRIAVDPNQLENALLNLCLNARDAMPDGGKLVVETANQGFDVDVAGSRNLSPGQYVMLSVSDNGVGMTPAVSDRAFEPFFTTKPIGRGTGLGLSMVFGFAQQSDGQARIYSEVGVGTTVHLCMPRYIDQNIIIEASTTQQSVVAEKRRQTILIVDDEPAIRMLISDLLEDLGYAAIEAADGPSGLAAIQSGARIDLLITDVGLPGMNGRQLAEAARAHRPSLSVLFITGYADNAVLSHGHLEPGMHILTKPFALDVLAKRVASMIP